MEIEIFFKHCKDLKCALSLWSIKLPTKHEPSRLNALTDEEQHPKIILLKKTPHMVFSARTKIPKQAHECLKFVA